MSRQDRVAVGSPAEVGNEAVGTLGRRGVVTGLLGGAAALSGAALAGAAPASAAAAPQVRGRFMAKSVMPVNVKDHGATGDGQTDDSDAIQAAVIAAEELGASVFFPAGTYLVSSPWRAEGTVTLRGEGMWHTTIAVSQNTGFIDSGTHPRVLVVEDMAFDNLGELQIMVEIDGDFVHEFVFRRCRFTNLRSEIVASNAQRNGFPAVELFNVGTGEFVDCLWHNPAAYAGHGTGVRLQGSPNATGGRGDHPSAGNRLRFTGHNRFLWLNNGIRVQPSDWQHTESTSAFPPTVLQYLEIDGAYFDLFWWLIPASHANEGAGVTYTETGLSDPSADFSDVPVGGRRPQVVNVRAMPVRHSGQVGTATAKLLVDENADFVAAGVRRMDIIRSSGRWAVVAVQPWSEENPDAVQVEEWLDDETLLPTTPPEPGADYTVYGVIFSDVVATTATTLTVFLEWRDLYGNVVVPENGTRYEVMQIRPTSPYFVGPGGALNSRLTNSTVRRHWADAADRAQSAQVIGNLFEDAQEGGLTLARGGHPGHFVIGNHFRHCADFSVFLNQTEAVMIGNRAEGGWWKRDTDFVGDFQLVNVQRCHVAHNISVAGPETHQDRNACVALRQQEGRFSEPTQPDETTGNILLYNRRYGHNPDEPDVRVLILGDSTPDDIRDNEIVGSRTVELLSGANGQHVETSGAGSPEGVLAAAPGSTFLRTDGGAGEALYVKESGTGTTGWEAK